MEKLKLERDFLFYLLYEFMEPDVIMRLMEAHIKEKSRQ